MGLLSVTLWSLTTETGGTCTGRHCRRHTVNLPFLSIMRIPCDRSSLTKDRHRLFTTSSSLTIISQERNSSVNCSTLTFVWHLQSSSCLLREQRGQRVLKVLRSIRTTGAIQSAPRTLLPTLLSFQKSIIRYTNKELDSCRISLSSTSSLTRALRQYSHLEIAFFYQYN